MKTSRAIHGSRAALLLLALSAGCETSKSSTPTAPTVAGPIPGVNISAPALLEPAQGFKFKESEQPIRLVVQNATTNGVRPLTYTFEVATDSGFTTKVFSRSSVAPGGRQDERPDRSARDRPRLLLARLGRGRRQHRRDGDGRLRDLSEARGERAGRRSRRSITSSSTTTTPTIQVHERAVRRPGRLPRLRVPGRDRPGVHEARRRRHRQRRARTDHVQQHSADATA